MLALDRAQRGSVQFLNFMSQYWWSRGHATSAGRKAVRLSTNTAQSVDRISTNKAYLSNYKPNSLAINLHFSKLPVPRGLLNQAIVGRV